MDPDENGNYIMPAQDWYVYGSDGKINPKAYITRAEVVQLLDNVSAFALTVDTESSVGSDDIWAGEIK